MAQVGGALPCRRCKADLRLVVQVRRRIDFLRERIDKATANDDPHADNLHAVGAWNAELQWLTGTVA